MKTMNTLKRLSAVLGTVAVTASMASMAAFASTANYCDKQDNKEAAYDGSYWVQPSKWKVDPINADNYTGSAKVTIDKKEIALKDLSDNSKNPVTVNFNATGIEGKVSSVGFHILWDTRLKVVAQNGKNVKKGAALSEFSAIDTPVEDGLECWVASAGGDESTDGVLFSMKFEVPSTAKAGDLYPIGIRYQYDGTTGDLFYNENQNAEGKLLMTYIFTKGIENGYIKISDPVTTTPAQTTPAQTTPAQTTPAQTAPATTPVVTDPATTPAVTDTATGTKAATTSKPAPTTTGKTTTAAKTTTKPAANDSPVTGVAGVGVAAAGLAIAVGTAFVLRKKED